MKRINENPTINDEILFDNLPENCQVKIYFLEKNKLCPKNVHELKYKTFNLINSLKEKLVSSDLKLVYSGTVNREFTWNAKGNFPGDYILEYNDEIIKFHLMTEQTFPRPYRKFHDTIAKYETLMKRYMPRMFDFLLTAQDLTPQVLQVLNNAVGKELAFIENSLNELSEVYDANLTKNQTILSLLASFFGKKLKTDNPIYWQRQIKNAVNLNKKKGTKAGLIEALDEAGVKLKKITKLWQIKSEYYHTDVFSGKTKETTFKLTKNPIDKVNLDLPHKLMDSVEEPGTTLLVLDNPLKKDTLLEIRYNFREVPKEREELEDYINKLPLADDREDIDGYPLKNWNMKLLEENDPLFDVLIPERFPFYSPIVYGKIRTTFLFSENIYNMDAYSGSLRNSYAPCDIDKNFMDECSYGQSSRFNLDLEVKNLSNERISEINDIIRENIPFHSSVFNLNIYGLNKTYFTINDRVEVEKEEDLSVTNFNFKDYIFLKIEEDGKEDKFLNLENEYEN